MRRQKRVLSLGLAAALTVLAAVPASAAALSDYDEATQARLQDNVMEYDELEALVLVYNPTLKAANAVMEDQLAELEVSVDDLRTNAGKLTWAADDFKESGNVILYQTYKATAEAVRDAASQYQKALDKARSHSSTRQLRYAGYQLTYAAQTLMMNYQTLTAQREMAQKAGELAAAAYESAQVQAGLGMATEADVLSAKQAVEQAADGLQTVDNAIVQLRQNLCMMTGWSYDAMPEIRRIPPTDVSWITQINLEEDKIKAVGNNGDLISLRSSGSSAGSSTVDRETRKRSIDEAEQQVCIDVEQKYQTIQQKLLEYQAANAAFESAQTAKHAADTRYANGMIGRLEYLQAEVAYLTKKAAKEQADMALLQAVNDYQWIVRGL